MKKGKYQLEDICPVCRDLYFYNRNKALMEEKGFIMKESFEEYKGVKKKYTFICKNNPNHIRKVTFSRVERIGGCQECRNKKRIEDNYKALVKEVEKRGGKVKYNQLVKTKKEKVTCICKEGHEFRISHQKIHSGQWCPECATGFEERLCRLLIEHIFKAKFTKAHPDFMPSPDSDKNLELDGYNEELKIAFEYNGKRWHSSAKAKNRDALKLKYAKEEGIKLIVVNQFKHYRPKELLENISSLCKEQDIELPAYSDEVDISSAYEGTTNKIVFDRIIKEKGGKYANGSKYLGLKEKVTLKCKNPAHPIFEKSPDNVIYYDNWCNECMKEEKKSLKLKKEKEAIKQFIKEHKKYIFLDQDAFESAFEPSHKYDFKCKKGHITTATYQEIKRRYTKYNELWCLECRKNKYKLEKILPSIQKIEKMYDVTFCKSKSDITNNSYAFICKKGHHFSLLSKFIYRLVKKTKSKQGICKECQNEKKLDEIKTLLYKNDNSLNIKSVNSKHKYKSTIKKNKKRTEADKIAIAQAQNDKYTKQKGEVALLSIKRNTDSKYSDVWGCSNPEHKPFILSIDNMRRRDQWCPYCTNRIVKKIPVEGIDYEIKN
jgi:hypothetical protein